MKKTFKDFGFVRDDSKVYKIFQLIPIFPNTITVKNLAKEAKLSRTETRILVNRLPVLAPVMQDDDLDILARTR